MLSNQTTTRFDNTFRVRYSLGFYWPSFAPFSFLFLVLYYIWSHYKKFNINTCIRRCHFLAQIRQEAGAKLEISEGENLNYSAELLKSKDKGPFKYFKEHPDEAEKYGRTETHKANPEAIANRAYANRNGNGDITSGIGVEDISR